MKKRTSELVSYLLERAKTQSDINEHLLFLYKMVLKTNAQKIVELGTRDGNSTCALVIGAAQTGGHVVSVDHGKGAEYAGEPPTWDSLAQTSALITSKLGLGNFWTFVVKDDVDFAREYHDEVDLLFIDTSHSYEQTKRELEAWGTKVVNRGLIVIHDTVSFPEQNKAIWEFLDLYPSSDFVEHKNCNGLGIITKNTAALTKTKIRRTRQEPTRGLWRDRVNRMQEALLDMRGRLREKDNELIAGLEQERGKLESDLLQRLKDPLGKLLLIYAARPDLQSSFPEVDKGDYSRLLDWAREQAVSGEDSAHQLLASYAPWYETNPWHSLSELSGELNRTKTELSQRESSVQGLEAERSRLSEELNRTKTEFASRDSSLLKLQEVKGVLEENGVRLRSELAAQNENLLKLQEEKATADSELSAIKGSFGYKFMRFYASRIDRLFPDRTSRGEFRKVVTTSLRAITEQGFRSYFGQAWEKIRRREFRIIEPVRLGLAEDVFYNAWIVENSPNPSVVRDSVRAFQYKPKVSILMPVYNTDPKSLREAIESVKTQLYENWELCICDNGSTRQEVKTVLLEASRSDKRIRLATLPDRRGIAGGTNAALALANGEFTGFLDHDDVLYSDALFEVVKLLNEDPELDYMYSDEDKIDLNGRRVEPFFKPDWSPDLLLSENYVTHFSVYRTSLLRSLRGLRDGYEGSQDYDLVLRATEKSRRIGHVRKVIYGWRISPTSTAGSATAKPIAYVSAVKALQDAVVRRGIKAQVEMLPIHRYRVKYEIEGKPLVTIIIPARTTKYVANCVRSIMEKTSYDNYEVLVVDNSKGMDLSKILDSSEKLRFIVDSSDFNWSGMNNQAAKIARGDYLVFLNDDTGAISGEWLSAMLEHAQREEVGAVGAKLLRANGTVQHAGILVGIHGLATNYDGMAASDPGYFALASMVRNCTGVTGACMMVRKSYFMQMGGFDEALGHSWNDVDFGIRLMQGGRWVVYTPFALLYHYVGGTRGERDTSSEELRARDTFRKKNIEFLKRGDPFYNPNLSTDVPYLPKCNLQLLSDPQVVLRLVYMSRQDLKDAFPEAAIGDWSNLYRWASRITEETDSSLPLLSRHQEWYKSKCG